MSTVNGKIILKDGQEMEFELYPEIAPIAVENFIKLAKEGFYEGLTFHRVIKGFVIQGGCPKGNGTGGPGYTIKGEFKSNGVDHPIKHEIGVLSMARSMAPNSAGSQFFIMVGNMPHLDGQYAAFGKITKNVECALNIAKTRVDHYDRPLTPVIIEKLKTHNKQIYIDYNLINKLDAYYFTTGVIKGIYIERNNSYTLDSKGKFDCYGV